MSTLDAYALIDAFNAAWNSRDLQTALSLCNPDVIFESTDPAPDGRRYQGLQAVRESWEPVFATENVHFDFEEIFLADGDRIVQRWRFDWGSGHVRGVDVITLRDGRIAEKLSYVKG